MGFVNSFLSYLVLMLVFVAVGGIAIFLGTTLRKSANAKAERTAEAGNTETQS